MSKQNRQVLAILAHPDDETFIFGGTIAHYTKQGVKVTVVSATKGEMGRRMGNPPFITRETMPIVREQELRDACRLLGAEEPLFLGIRDKTVEFQDMALLVNRIAGLVRAYKPDVVLTFHPVWGGHADHCAIGQAAIDAVKAAGDEGYQTTKPHGEPFRTPSLLYISFGDTMKQPERYGLTKADIVRIDVSDSLQEKLQAFRAHRTQTELDELVWQPDEMALRKFGRYEYFIIGDQTPRKRLDDLFIE
jgi:bacillithiol biosynthesis deacetylase BshB2